MEVGSTNPREISPELVLVDPELARVARQSLPDPGAFLSTLRPALHTTPAPASGSGRRFAAARGRASLSGQASTRITRRLVRPRRILVSIGLVALAVNGALLVQALLFDAPKVELASPARAGERVSVRAANPVGQTGALSTRLAPGATTAGAPTRVTSSGTKTARPGSGNETGREPRHLSRPASEARRVSARTVRPGGALLELRWAAVPGARYYNVVLWSKGERVLDLWPTEPQVTLPREWAYRGVHHRLAPGRYLWFAYPGLGEKSRGRYGGLAESGTVVAMGV